MRKMNKLMSAAVLAVAVAGGSYAFLGSPLMPTAAAHLRDHPKLARADEALHDAEEYLRSSPSDFHGHKEEALHAIHEARTKISLIADEEEHHVQADGTFLPDTVEHKHPKLWEAHEALKEAAAYLREAKNDFHGHKEEAIAAVEEAQRQIKRIMED